jgi:hypothetical protein
MHLAVLEYFHLSLTCKGMQRTREGKTGGVQQREGVEISKISSRVLCIPRLNEAAAERARTVSNRESPRGSLAESVSVGGVWRMKLAGEDR